MAAAESLRQRADAWIASAPVQRFIIALILVNAVVLGMETSARLMQAAGAWLIGADRVILGIFVAEILIKLYARRLAFFRDPWNVFDFVVVGIALVPASGPLAVLRVLRLLRLVSMIPKLRFVVEALLKAVPGIISILGLLLLIFYVFAVISTGLFAESHPEWFGNLGASMYTLFQIMTLESWSMGIARPVMEIHPLAWAFFVPFILVATFTMLNLFIAIIVNTMQTMQEGQSATITGAVHEEGTAITDAVHEESSQLHSDLDRVQHENRRLHEDMRALHREIVELRATIRSAGRGQS